MSEKATLQQLDALMRSRHSCRGFRPGPVPQDTINAIVSTAQRVPSWCNAQPWKLIITTGAETENFRAHMIQTAQSAGFNTDVPFPASYQGVYHERRRACGWQLYDAVGVTKGDRVGSTKQMAENYRLFGAPHVAILTSDRSLGQYGILDCGGFVSGFSIAAEAAGVSVIAQASIAGFSDQVRAYFDIPEDRLILCALSFGYEDVSHPANSFRTDRATADQVIDWRGSKPD